LFAAVDLTDALNEHPPRWCCSWSGSRPTRLPNRSFRHDPTIAGIDANLARIGAVGYNIGSMQPLNSSANRRLRTLDGTPASCVGLAAGPKQDPRCVRRAFAGGINYFFFYGPGNRSFIEELASLGRKKGTRTVILDWGSGGQLA
jgi:hypothetical protein